MSEPLASGGLASLASCPDRVGSNGPFAPGDVAARPAEKEDSGPTPLPPLDEEQAAAIEDASVEASREPDIPRIGPRPPTPEIVELIGGWVSITVVEDAITLNAATPRPGYVADLSFETSDQLTVTFWNALHLSTLIAEIDDEGELVVQTEEAAT